MSILNIGESALLAAQTGIATTGHNIANASTEGYNRQVVIQSAAAGDATGIGYIGRGTRIVTINRVYNEFLVSQVNSGLSSKGELGTYYSQIQQIDNMLADSTVGLTPTLQEFFSGVQDVSTDPSSAVTRQSLLSSAETLVARFKNMDAQLGEMYESINSQVTASVNMVNTYAQEIASLNDTIEKAAASGSSQPNDLLDQRDQLVAKLSEEIKLSIVKQNNSYNVYIGNGQPLVVGAKTNEMVTLASPNDPTRLEVGFNNSGAIVNLTGENLAGGNLAGFVSFRSETLDVARNSIGRIATALATSFNEQHQLGQDLNGDLGGAFFNVAAPVASASRNNTSSGEVTAAITDASQLTISDYRLTITKLADTTAGTPVEYQISRLSDGKVFALSGANTTVDGVLFDVSDTYAVGDSFVIQPVVNGASLIEVAITDTAKIAAAAPILASAPNSNMGTGAISQGVVNSRDASLQEKVTITFTSSTTFDVTGDINGTLALNQAYTAGDDISFNGWTVQISGLPETGDEFTVEANADGIGDSRNALLLGELQTTNLLDGSSTSYQGAYSKLVNFIGNKTNELDVTSAAASAFYNQAIEAQQSESGVNLDEEAADLLRYQQAYQAAAQLMKIAEEMFDLLLSLGR